MAEKDGQGYDKRKEDDENRNESGTKERESEKTDVNWCGA